MSKKKLLTHACLFGALLMPISHFISRTSSAKTPQDFDAVLQQIIQRGYKDVKALRPPNVSEQELLTRFEALQKEAGLDNVHLLIGISNRAYAGAVGDYVVLSDAHLGNFSKDRQDASIGHELYHVLVERAQKKPYEAFSDDEIKQVESDADKFAYFLVRKPGVVESNLQQTDEFNRKVDYESAPWVLKMIAFNEIRAAIDKAIDSGSSRHPPTAKRIKDLRELEKKMPINTNGR